MIVESKSGVVCGMVGGLYKLLDVVNTDGVVRNILIVGFTALISGFLGAVGAHIFKLLIKKIKR